MFIAAARVAIAPTVTSASGVPRTDVNAAQGPRQVSSSFVKFRQVSSSHVKDCNPLCGRSWLKTNDLRFVKSGVAVWRILVGRRIVVLALARLAAYDQPAGTSLRMRMRLRSRSRAEARATDENGDLKAAFIEVRLPLRSRRFSPGYWIPRKNTLARIPFLRKQLSRAGRIDVRISRRRRGNSPRPSPCLPRCAVQAGVKVDGCSETWWTDLTMFSRRSTCERTCRR